MLKNIAASIDALNIAISRLTPEEEHDLILEIDRAAEELARYENVHINYVRKSVSGYHRGIYLPLCRSFTYGKKNSETPALMIYVGPKRPNQNSILLSFKGYPLKYEHYEMACAWLYYLTRNMEHRQFLDPDNVYVTSYHLAIDINKPITDLGVERNNCSKSAYFIDRGKLTGYTLGSLKSPKQTTVYSRELKAKAYSESQPDVPVTRIELKKAKRLHWSELEDELVDNLSQNDVQLYELKSIMKDRALRPYLKNCIANLGIHQVIMAQDDQHIRKQLRRMLCTAKIGRLSASRCKKRIRKACKPVHVFCKFNGRDNDEVIKKASEQIRRHFLPEQT